VLNWIAGGKTIADTSDILSTSQRTIEEHLAHARAKLGAGNTVQAVAKALYWRQITP
jgi:DNA-binding CsgD family transcriptional regulator